MNYMKQVAEMLGVEMGERFNISGWNENTKFYITEEGLMREGFMSPFLKQLSLLLSGENEIIKEPWKPKFGEIYHFVTVGGAIDKIACVECTFDCALALMGNRFRTEAEAKPHVDEMVAKMRAVME